MKIDHIKKLKGTRIISCFSEFHQELYLLRLIQQTKTKLQIIIFNQNTKNDLIKLLDHYHLDLKKYHFTSKSDYLSDQETAIYLSDFDQLNQLVELHPQNKTVIFLSATKLTELRRKKKINQSKILSSIPPTLVELERIQNWQKTISFLANKHSVDKELILTEGQIRLISLLNYKSPTEFIKVPGIGQGWIEKWSDKILI